MARLTIYYGRIVVLDAESPQEEIFERPPPVLEAITKARSVKRYNHEWIIGNIDVAEDRGLVQGRLGYPETEHLTRQDVDKQSLSFVEKEYDVANAISGAFVIDYKTGDIAFEGDGIGPTGFINHLAALLTATHIANFKGELRRHAETYREFVAEVDKVTRVWFEVRPTNPRDLPIFKPLDEGMKAANAKRQRVVIENQDEGLILQPPDSPEEETANPAVMGIEMNDDGYGEGYRIDGERDGQPLRFDSTAGGSLVRDVLEDASDDPDERARIIAGTFDGRSPSEPDNEPSKSFEPSPEHEAASLPEEVQDSLMDELNNREEPRAELEPPVDEGEGNGEQ